MKRYMIILLAGIIVAGCQFSSTEKKRIMEGSENETMRLFVINNERDSILLRRIAKPIKFKKNNEILEHLSKRMLATVIDSVNPGVGIAAPQVGISRQMICVQRFDKAGEPFEFYVNPVIEPMTKDQELGREGCLSVPGYQGQVPRFTKVKLHYCSLDGTKKEEEITDFTAIIFQHEIDHLKGVLYYDRVEGAFGGLKVSLD